MKEIYIRVDKEKRWFHCLDRKLNHHARAQRLGAECDNYFEASTQGQREEFSKEIEELLK